MRHFNSKEVASLKSASERLYTQLENCGGWIQNHLKFEERAILSQKVKKEKAEVFKIRETISSKPVFALFGISQVGKSYLVHNILSVDGRPLEIICGNNRIDFLKKVNPQGSGAESTGVVTRFSIDEPCLSSEFPIRSKLLSTKDIVIILADSFFSDVSRLDTYPTKSEFSQRIKELKSEFSASPITQNILTEDHLWDMAKYFGTNFNKFSHYVGEIESSGFWLDAGELIKYIPASQWYRLFELIWNENKLMTKIFNGLIDVLTNLNFDTEVLLPTEAILRENGALLDVQRLNDLFGGSENINVHISNGETKQIEASKLCALTAELSLKVDSELADKKTFLKNTDILDFPGARSRESFLISNINEEAVVKMFLRGKISYLFNKYSADLEINNLLFCMKDEKIEVNELAGILNEWIEKNIGHNSESREKTIGNHITSPLFVILTFFNRQLSYDPVNDDNDVTYKWENRFNRFFEDQITFKYLWHTNWTTSQPNFTNFFLLRDYKFSGDIFLSENDKEIGIHEAKITHWEKLRRSFIEYPFVKKHFKNPEETWNESASPMNDGSERIINALLPAANNYVKIKNLTERLDITRKELLIELSKYYISDDIKELRDKAYRDANDIKFSFVALFANPEFNFALFLKQLMLDEINVFNELHKNFLKASSQNTPEHYKLFRKMYPELSESKSREENLQLLVGKLLLNNTLEVEEYLKSKHIDLDEVLENKVYTSASKLVDSTIELWIQLLEIPLFEKYIQMGLDKKILDLYLQSLKQTFNSLHIRSRLISLYEEKTRLINIPEYTEEYLASITTNMINEFVANFGFTFMGQDRLNELFDISREYNEDLTTIIHHEIAITTGDLEKVYDSDEGTIASSPLADNFNAYLIKMKLAMISNCGAVNFDAEANTKLKFILNELETLEFTLAE
jgi:hypothetical protein